MFRNLVHPPKRQGTSGPASAAVSSEIPLCSVRRLMLRFPPRRDRRRRLYLLRGPLRWLNTN